MARHWRLYQECGLFLMAVSVLAGCGTKSEKSRRSNDGIAAVATEDESAGVVEGDVASGEALAAAGQSGSPLLIKVTDQYTGNGVLNQFYLNVGPKAHRNLYTCFAPSQCASDGGRGGGVGCRKPFRDFIVADLKRCPVGGGVETYLLGAAAEVGTPGTVTLYGCEKTTTVAPRPGDGTNFAPYTVITRRDTTIDLTVCTQPGWSVVEILGGIWVSPQESDRPAYTSNGGAGGCYRNASGGGFYTNAAGASCGLCPDKVPGICRINMAQFAFLPTVNGTGSDRYDGTCGGCPGAGPNPSNDLGQVPAAASNPSIDLGQVPTGPFRVGDGVYFSNGSKAICSFNSMVHYTWVTQRVNLDGVTSYNSLPTRQVSDGTCNYPEGLFMVGGGVYYSNGNDAFCSFPSWDSFVRRTGRTSVAGIPVLPSAFPPGMRNDGSCGS